MSRVRSCRSIAPALIALLAGTAAACPPSGGGCSAADFNLDGMITANDYSGWANEFQVGGPCGDLNNDGVWDYLDYEAFIVATRAVVCGGVSPSNDSCANAIPITFAGIMGTNEFASQQLSVGQGAGCGTLSPTGYSMYQDVWYRLTAPSSLLANIRFIPYSAMSAKIAVYDATAGFNCSQGLSTAIACAPGPVPLVANRTYYIQVGIDPDALVNGSQTIVPGTFDLAFTNASCPSDWDLNGSVDCADTRLFVDAFEQGTWNADVNFDGGIDGADVEAWVIQLTDGTNAACPPPVNDNAINATPINGPGIFAFDTTLATTTPGQGSGGGCGLPDLTEQDLWYCWTATFTGSAQAVIQESPPLMAGGMWTRWNMAVYPGAANCATIPVSRAGAIACAMKGQGPSSLGQTSFPVVMGQKYLIQIGVAAQYFPGCGTLTMTNAGCPTTPAHDTCATPITLTSGQSHTANTACATTDGPAQGTYPFTPADGIVNNDVWYRFNATANGTLSVSTCDAATTFDTRVLVYDGTSCTGLASRMIAGDDESCASDRASINVPVVNGASYLIRVGGASGLSGTVKTTLTFSAGALCPTTVGTLSGQRLFTLSGTPNNVPWSWALRTPSMSLYQPSAGPVLASAGTVGLKNAFVTSIANASTAAACGTNQVTATTVSTTSFRVRVNGSAAPELWTGTANALPTCTPVSTYTLGAPGSTGVSCIFNPTMTEVPLLGTDCNGNNQDDAIDLLSGSSLDLNFNNTPDECETLSKAMFTFEPPNYAGSPGGTLLSGQGWTLPGSFANMAVYTGIAGLAPNPAGSTQFIAGANTAGTAAAEHAAAFSRVTTYDIVHDIAAMHSGDAPAPLTLGSLSLEPAAGSASLALRFGWTNSAAQTITALYDVYDAAGTPMTAQQAGVAWGQLAANHWYRMTTRIDFGKNRIVSVTLWDLTSNASATVNPTNWYLRGGAAGSTRPTALRLTSPTPGSTNVLAWDNLTLCESPSILGGIGHLPIGSATLNASPSGTVIASNLGSGGGIVTDYATSDGVGMTVTASASLTTPGAVIEHTTRTDRAIAAWKSKKRLEGTGTAILHSVDFAPTGSTRSRVRLLTQNDEEIALRTQPNGTVLSVTCGVPQASYKNYNDGKSNTANGVAVAPKEVTVFDEDVEVVFPDQPEVVHRGVRKIETTARDVDGGLADVVVMETTASGLATLELSQVTMGALGSGTAAPDGMTISQTPNGTSARLSMNVTVARAISEKGIQGIPPPRKEKKVSLFDIEILDGSLDSEVAVQFDAIVPTAGPRLPVVLRAIKEQGVQVYDIVTDDTAVGVSQYEVTLRLAGELVNIVPVNSGQLATATAMPKKLGKAINEKSVQLDEQVVQSSGQWDPPCTVVVDGLTYMIDELIAEPVSQSVEVLGLGDGSIRTTNIAAYTTESVDLSAPLLFLGGLEHVPSTNMQLSAKAQTIPGVDVIIKKTPGGKASVIAPAAPSTLTTILPSTLAYAAAPPNLPCENDYLEINAAGDQGGLITAAGMAVLTQVTTRSYEPLVGYGSDPYTLEVRSGGQLVHRETDKRGPAMTLALLDELATCEFITSDTVPSGLMIKAKMLPLTAVQVVGGPAVAADEILIIPEAGDIGPTRLKEVNYNFSPTCELEAVIGGETIGIDQAAGSAVGDSRVIAVPGGSEVRPGPSGSPAGLIMGELNTVYDSIGLAMSPNAGYIPQTGHWMQAHMLVGQSGTNQEGDATLRSMVSATGHTLSLNASRAAAAEVTVDLIRNGVVVRTIPQVPVVADLGEASAAPIAASALNVWFAGEGKACYGFSYEAPAQITIQGQTTLADAIMVTPLATNFIPDQLVGMAVTFSGPTAMTIVSAQAAPIAPPPPCPADFNQDGGVDGADVDAFFSAWEQGDSAADVNLDGGVDGSDIGVFFAAWEAGGC